MEWIQKDTLVKLDKLSKVLKIGNIFYKMSLEDLI